MMKDLFCVCHSITEHSNNLHVCLHSPASSPSSKSKSTSSSSKSTTYRSRRRCGTEVHVIALEADNGEVKECARALRRNTRYFHDKLHPKRMDDFEVVRVRDCTKKHSMKNKMLKLERNRSTTNKDVRVIFAVVSKKDLSDDCEEALRKLPRQVEKDLSCRDIRDMNDESVIRVNSEYQCKKWRLRNKVRRAADLI